MILIHGLIKILGLSGRNKQTQPQTRWLHGSSSCLHFSQEIRLSKATPPFSLKSHEDLLHHKWQLQHIKILLEAYFTFNLPSSLSTGTLPPRPICLYDAVLSSHWPRRLGLLNTGVVSSNADRGMDECSPFSVMPCADRVLWIGSPLFWDSCQISYGLN
jgi:hypothetical protein